MGVQPPSSGSDDEPETIEFGIAAVDAHLKRSDLSFPASRSEIEAALGDVDVPYDVHGNAIPLSSALEEVGRDHFEGRQELLNALHPVFEHYREQRSGSVLQQLRSLLPF